MNAIGILLASVVMTLGFHAMYSAHAVPPCDVAVESAHEVRTATGVELTCDWSVA